MKDEKPIENSEERLRFEVNSPEIFLKFSNFFCICIKSNELRVELVGSRFTMINEGSLISLI